MLDYHNYEDLLDFAGLTDSWCFLLASRTAAFSSCTFAIYTDENQAKVLKSRPSTQKHSKLYPQLIYKTTINGGRVTSFSISARRPSFS